MVISSNFYNANLYAAIFASISKLDIIEHVREFTRIINSVVFVLLSANIKHYQKRLIIRKALIYKKTKCQCLRYKNINLEISPILAKLHKHWLMGKPLPNVYQISRVYLVFKDADESSFHAHCVPISTISDIVKLFESIINNMIVDHLNKNNLWNDKL